MTARANPDIARTSGYFLLNLATGLFWFCLLVPLLAVSLGTMVIWVGFPLLALTLVLARGAASLERSWLRVMLDVDVRRPYRPIPEGNLFVRARAMMTDPATWRDFAYWLIMLPLGLVEFAMVVALWPAVLSLTFFPLFWQWLPRNFEVSLGNSVWLVDSFAKALPVTVLGILLGLLVLPLVKATGRGHAALAQGLLGPSRTSFLEAETDRLSASRARGVEAAEAERRRIERDLHDGAQQRLVAVAMGLGRARGKMESDPEAAAALIAEAHADAKLAISELRDLARGIYPSVLGDRGLDPALSSLAAKCPIPVDVTVDVEPRPPTAVESAAYFTVAEALTNIAKHAGATRAAVDVSRTENSVVVEITDNGHGGAQIRPGGGLAGLADRAATIDGVVVVVSPVGGPTVIRTELPCAW
ncbi:sensor domain-containing protein [Actinosynnema sp. NPDC047251]|uniref:histidine kinase n=1 Tax=Saccharothrix espanaensis (strain ATCC 51144 / DSM 44229 / JCM 9112 / NBRC 15066 / NRRL 15764) TaxID=1179773 RepID=K0JVW8_SACES|nr:sensor domain-containing protein [Saccharothrix espanaensis]CCH28358.1 putative histidine kinase [Saccharothrix espanaensis DSM 44229]